MLLRPETYWILLDYIDKIHDTTAQLTIKENPTETELLLSWLAVLQEECGELATEVRKLTRMSFNQKKVDSFSHEDLEEELADVAITLLLLIKRLWITTLDDTILRKIGKNNVRGY